MNGISLSISCCVSLFVVTSDLRAGRGALYGDTKMPKAGIRDWCSEFKCYRTDGKIVLCTYCSKEVRIFLPFQYKNFSAILVIYSISFKNVALNGKNKFLTMATF